MKSRHCHYWLLVGLYLMAHVALATPTQILDMQREFLSQSYQVLDGGDQPVLLITSDATTAITRGVAVLVGESGISVASDKSLAPLAERLNAIGWVTMLVAPPAVGLEQPGVKEGSDNDTDESTEQPSAIGTLAAHEQASKMDPDNFLAHQAQLVSSMQMITKQSRQYPGFLLVIAQGTSAAWLTKIYAEQPLVAPDALVVISPFWPTRQYNPMLASQMAITPMPVLDIYHSRDNSWSLQSAKQRKISAIKALKLQYRQREISTLVDPAQEASQLHKEIYGWLHSLGW